MKTKRQALAGLDAAIPAGVFGGVRVGAAKGSVVTASHAIVARVLPAEVPAVSGASAFVGYFY